MLPHDTIWTCKQMWGGDFILESKNKRIKMWLPLGVHTIQRWLRVCHNLESVDCIKDRIGKADADDSTDTVFR